MDILALNLWDAQMLRVSHWVWAVGDVMQQCPMAEGEGAALQQGCGRPEETISH